MVASVRSLVAIALFVVMSGPALAAEPVPSKDQGSAAATSPDGASAAAGKEASGTAAKKAEPVIKGRIPRGWGELELSGEQKAEIYKLQEKHRLAELEVAKELKTLRERVRELNKKMDTMKAASDVELKNVLTPSQREKLSKRDQKAAAPGESTPSPSK